MIEVLEEVIEEQLAALWLLIYSFHKYYSFISSTFEMSKEEEKPVVEEAADNKEDPALKGLSKGQLKKLKEKKKKDE